MSELMTKLSAKFDASEHKKHPAKGYTYVAIDKMIGRLNEVMGERYSTSILNTYFNADSVVIHTRIAYTDENGVTEHRDGIGACPYPKKGMDIDDVVKTAYAESIKKGAHQWGVALYLWDDGERAEVEAEMRNPKPQTTNKPSALPPGNAMNLPIQIDPKAERPTLIGEAAQKTGKKVSEIRQWCKDNGLPLNSNEMNPDQFLALMCHIYNGKVVFAS